MACMLWKTVWSFLKKLKTDCLHDPATPLLHICPKTSFTTAKEWNQPRCPWIKKKVVIIHYGIAFCCKEKWTYDIFRKKMEERGNYIKRRNADSEKINTTFFLTTRFYIWARYTRNASAFDNHLKTLLLYEIHVCIYTYQI